jgi:hypothetical protein
MLIIVANTPVDAGFQKFGQKNKFYQLYFNYLERCSAFRSLFLLLAPQKSAPLKSAAVKRLRESLFKIGLAFKN